MMFGYRKSDGNELGEAHNETLFGDRVVSGMTDFAEWPMTAT